MKNNIIIGTKKLRNRKIRNNIFKVLDFIVVLVLIYFVFGYVNFYKISNDKKPLFTLKEKSYAVSNGNIKVYDNLLYKIVEHEVFNVNKSYSLKLWFMKDVN